MTETEAQPTLEPSQPENYPFWNYSDLALFVGFFMPSLLAGALIVKAIVRFAQLTAHSRAAELLPAQFLGYAILFSALYLLFKLQYRRPFWRSLKWVRASLSSSAAVLSGFLLAIVFGALGVLLKTPDIDTPMKELLSDRTSVILVAIFAMTLGPLCEELAFRGFMQPLFVRTLGSVPGIVLAAVLFGLLHLAQYAFSWRHGLLITVAGIAFGWMRHLSGSTRAAAVMHAAYNSTFFVGYLVQAKDLPSSW